MTRRSIRVTEPGNPWRRALAATLVVASLSGQTLAQPRDPADLALAETLFREAKELIDQGNFKAACPKLAESHRLDPAGGTVLLLGVCYEGARQWASAWTSFNDALALAIKDGRKDREQRARDRIAAIEPQLARVTLVLSAELSATPGLRILRDGKELPKAAWSSVFPLDPGPHRFEAQADGYKGALVELSLGYEGARNSVQFPAKLEKLASLPAASASVSAPAAPAPTAPASSSQAARPLALPEDNQTRRTLAYGLGAVGVVGLGIGAFFGVRAMSRFSDANDLCPDLKCSKPEAVERSKQAHSDAISSNIGFGVGLLGLGAGVTLLLLSRPEPASASRGALRVGASPPVRGVSDGYLRLEGSFLCSLALDSSASPPCSPAASSSVASRSKS